MVVVVVVELVVVVAVVVAVAVVVVVVVVFVVVVVDVVVVLSLAIPRSLSLSLALFLSDLPSERASPRTSALSFPFFCDSMFGDALEVSFFSPAFKISLHSICLFDFHAAIFPPVRKRHKAAWYPI